tara:strand:+ start:49 stop:264 length:216 start_codon:yes stop_codon:yes gene_type:complete
MDCFKQDTEYEGYWKETTDKEKESEIFRLVILATGDLNNAEIMNNLDKLTTKELTKMQKKIDKIWSLITEL